MMTSTLSMMQIKDYVMRQWGKILAGRVSLADFVFAKEVCTMLHVSTLVGSVETHHLPCSWFAYQQCELSNRLRLLDQTLLSGAISV